MGREFCEPAETRVTLTYKPTAAPGDVPKVAELQQVSGPAGKALWAAARSSMIWAAAGLDACDSDANALAILVDSGSGTPESP